MSQFGYKQNYRRNLPHIVPPDATFFVTYRLAGSIPKNVVAEYKQKKEWLELEAKRLNLQHENLDVALLDDWQLRFLQFKREWFVKFEDYLHQAKFGPHWLREDAIAKIIADSLHHFDNERYFLHSYCVMSNHVHVALSPFVSSENLVEEKSSSGHTIFTTTSPTLAKIMHSLKSFTAKEANKVLGRTGGFWEHESYDHYVRDETEYERIVKYILQNPVKAKLVENWQDWRWSYCENQ